MDHAIKPRPNFDMHEVESSQLAAIGHCAETNTLAIRFPPKKSGVSDTYHYQNVSAELFAEFLAAESHGSFFIQRIKKDPVGFPYEKVTEAETNVDMLIGDFDLMAWREGGQHHMVAVNYKADWKGSSTAYAGAGKPIAAQLVAEFPSVFPSAQDAERWFMLTHLRNMSHKANSVGQSYPDALSSIAA